MLDEIRRAEETVRQADVETVATRICDNCGNEYADLEQATCVTCRVRYYP